MTVKLYVFSESGARHVTVMSACNGRSSVQSLSHVRHTTLKITVSCLDAYPSTQVALRITIVSCSTHQQLFKTTSRSLERDRCGFHLRSFIQSGVPWAKTTQLPQAKSNVSESSKAGGADFGHFVVGWYSAQFMYKIQGTVESSFICHVPHAPRTRLDASECPLRDINTHTTVSNSLLRCSSNCRFLSLGPIHQGSPRSCVHGAVTVRSRHTKNSPILVFMSSMSIPSLPRRKRSTSPCECPLQTALVPLSTTFSSLNILRVGSVPFQLPRGT